MGIHIESWTKHVPITEAAVKEAVREAGLIAMRWEGEPRQTYAPHHHLLAKTLWCASGHITFQVDGREVTLGAGDKMILPAGTVHSAVAGPQGVACFEAPPLHENTTVYDT